jgi:transcriptional regulator with XRE-family HTH domain
MTSRMTPGTPRTLRTSDVTAARIKELRRERGLTAARLAERCAELGAPAITTNVVSNIETRRRDVNVDELMAFALALDVPPVSLLTPTTPDTDQPMPAPLALTRDVQVDDPLLLRRWIRGQQALPTTQDHLYYAAAREHADTGTPGPALDSGFRLLAQFEASAAQLVATIRDQVRDLLTDLENSITTGGTADDVLTALAQARARLSGTAPATPPASTSAVDPLA